MIIGVGIDVVDVGRFTRQVERVPRLADRLFTPEERHLPPASLAARFAAKEAVAKALGAPVGLRWTDCTVHRGDDGRPHLDVRGSVAARAAQLGATSFHVSLSHDAGIASAVVVAEASQPAPAVQPADAAQAAQPASGQVEPTAAEGSRREWS